MLRGQFKIYPNHPTRPDRTRHPYAPPEQVEGELRRLFTLYEGYASQGDVHPLLLGAWLHHRFVQVHPFDDGNGRVGRALLSWHLPKSDFLPVVVNRADRSTYLHALERSDMGDLSRLVEFLASISRKAVHIAMHDYGPEASADLLGSADDPNFEFRKEDGWRNRK